MKYLYKFLLSTALILVTSLSFVQAENLNEDVPKWSIDHAHSAVNFQVRHFFTPVSGTFSEYDGDIYFNPEDIDNSHVDVNITVSSVDTRNSQRDGHLQNEDFFEVTTWPTMHFKSDRITHAGDNNFVAHGELTIRDVTKNIELPFEFLGMMEHPMMENTMVAGLKSEYKLLRNDYGVGTGSWAETGVIGNEVSIEILLELTSSAE